MKPPPTPPPPKMPSVVETMERFAKMIPEGVQRNYPPVSAPDTQNAPRPESGERRGPKKKSSAKYTRRRSSKRGGKSSSSSDTSSDEDAWKMAKKTSYAPPTGTTALSCYGCGAPEVIWRNCSICAGNAPQTM